MNHPLVKTFKRDAPRCGIGEYGRRPEPPRVVENRVVGFQWGPAVRHHQQNRPATTESSHLEITSVLSNIRIVERTLGMGLFERAIVEHVVEDHRDAQRSDLNWLSRLVLQRETQYQFASLKRPSSGDLKRKVRGQGRREVG